MHINTILLDFRQAVLPQQNLFINGIRKHSKNVTRTHTHDIRKHSKNVKHTRARARTHTDTERDGEAMREREREKYCLWYTSQERLSQSEFRILFSAGYRKNVLHLF